MSYSYHYYEVLRNLGLTLHEQGARICMLSDKMYRFGLIDVTVGACIGKRIVNLIY